MRKEHIVKSRAKIKENRRRKREELLDRRDFCGIKDPTPYQAVKNIVNQQKQKQKQKA